MQELFDTVHNMGQMNSELLFTCVDAILDDLGNHVSIDVAVSLGNSIRTSILPWGIIPRVLRGDLSMNETDVAQEWTPTIGHPAPQETMCSSYC